MPDRMRGVKSDSPEQESADDALKRIVDGFQHFRREVFPEQQALFKKLANSQRPRAMFITCADSRIVPELITQSSPGDLFVTRNVGNVVPPYGQMNGGVSTAIEYAVLALGVHHIIVCGHSDCGAMRAVLDPQTLERMPTVMFGCGTPRWRARWWRTTATAAPATTPSGCSPKRTWWPSSITCAPTPRWPRAWPAGNCSSTAGCTTSSAQIRAYDAKQGRFLPLDGEHPVPMATPAPRYLNS